MARYLWTKFVLDLTFLPRRYGGEEVDFKLKMKWRENSRFGETITNFPEIRSFHGVESLLLRRKITIGSASRKRASDHRVNTELSLDLKIDSFSGYQMEISVLFSIEISMIDTFKIVDLLN